MATTKLTEKTIAKLTAPTASGKQELHWDEALTGFAVLVSGVSKSKTYIVQRSLNGNKRRVTIASVAELPLVEARKRATTLLLDLRAGIDPKAKRATHPTLRQALESYIVARKDLRPKSAEFYRATTMMHLERWLDKPLAEINTEMVQKRHAAIQAEVAASGRGTGGRAIANSVARTLRLLWNFAKENDSTLGPNPAQLRRQWFKVAARERIVKDEDLPAFYKAVCELPNPIHRAYVLLLLFTGLRRNEGAGLRWCDVDLTARTIKITATRAKNGRPLNLPMSDFIFDLLVGVRQLTGSGEFVFPAAGKGKHITATAPIFAQIAEASSVTVSPHDLRRGFITIANDAEISGLSLKALVNHTVGGSGDVTENYTQLTAKRLMGPMQRVTDRIKTLCGIEDLAGENVAKIRAGQKVKA